MFKNPFSFNGRIRRLEFGLSYILYFAVYFMVIILTEAVHSAIFFLIMIPNLWFLLAQGSKRCHDRNNQGIYLIIPFYVLWMLFADSDHGPNDYGPNPKGIGNEDEFNDIGKPEVEVF